jgi:putative transcriptional regulator
MGIVLNRPLQQPSFGQLLKQLEIMPHPPSRSITLCAGGPVETQRGFVLHSADWTAEATLRVSDDTALTASVDILKAIAGGGGPRDCILALGYAGWGPGQLDGEMLQNAWLSAPVDATLLWGGDAAAKWRHALGRLGIDPLLLSSAAGRA